MQKFVGRPSAAAGVSVTSTTLATNVNNTTYASTATGRLQTHHSIRGGGDDSYQQSTSGSLSHATSSLPTFESLRTNVSATKNAPASSESLIEVGCDCSICACFAHLSYL